MENICAHLPALRKGFLSHRLPRFFSHQVGPVSLLLRPAAGKHEHYLDLLPVHAALSCSCHLTCASTICTCYILHQTSQGTGLAHASCVICMAPDHSKIWSEHQPTATKLKAGGCAVPYILPWPTDRDAYHSQPAARTIPCTTAPVLIHPSN